MPAKLSCRINYLWGCQKKYASVNARQQIIQICLVLRNGDEWGAWKESAGRGNKGEAGRGGKLGGAWFLTFEDDGPKARVFALKIGGFFVVFVAKILRVVDLNLTTARILDRLDHLTLSEGREGGYQKRGLGGFRDHAS